MTYTAAPAGSLVREVAKLVADVMVAELGLDAAHCLLGDQKWDIPTDKKLFLVVFDDAGPTIGASNFIDTDETSATYLSEIQQSAVMHDVRIEMMSYDNEARVRKEEPGLALASIFSQQLQEQYRVQIGRAQKPVNASDTEVTGRLFKYVTHVNVTALHQKVKAAADTKYDDKFNGALTDGTINPPEVQTQ
jgi:hypothetical protein